MCHQTAALVQRALDRVGIATVSLSVLEEVTREVVPSRALVLPHDLGFPLGAPKDRELQKKIVREALELCASDDLPLLTFRDR